ncbi:urease accessory protein D isoform X2 [Rhodamnia argentea]|uniref:Urease accessory protein D isoform X1 n=1 Tax=Rhodamnia argentea TaxID=178133 RepID=A0A8B8R4I2_9MYRT|nr:urease accessory protein D isoform X2 [Rhodamnia argentea]XP_030553543.1 urease accessory protein D isoform X2 [Rhodamnia argentea]
METGKIVIEKVRGKSTVTKSFSKYPLKFIIPRKVGPSRVDAVWIYALTYGGGIVSGDDISCKLEIGAGCTAVLTTQASTKVYKSLGSKCSEQSLEAEIGSNSMLVLIPDPVTCFSTARYFQKQVFRVRSDSNLVLVDWITSGRHESGEKWDFTHYKSTNNIFLESDQPLFLDTVLLEQGSIVPLAERMQDYQVIAMVVLLGPMLRHIQGQVQEDVKRMMAKQLQGSPARWDRQMKSNTRDFANKPSLIASCSAFGQKGEGVIVRIASLTTESVYQFLKHQLAGLEALLGLSPYS